jgi:hypothetical protein
MRRVFVVAALAGIAVLLSAAAAQATPTWTPYSLIVVAARGDADMNAQGDAVAAWNAAEDGLGAAVHRPGGGWQRVTVPVLPGSACEVRTRIDRSGTATMVWRQSATANDCTVTTVWAAVLPPGAIAFGAPQQLSVPGGLDHLAVAANPSGGMLAVWVRTTAAPGSNGQIEGALRPAGGSFAGQVIATLGGDGQDVSRVDAALDDADHAAALWRDSSAANVAYAVQPGTNFGWVSQPFYGVSDAIALAFEPTSGDLHVVWAEQATAPPGGMLCDTIATAEYAVCAARRSTAGVWQTREILATAPAVVEDVVLAAGGLDRTIAMWRTGGTLRAAARASGATSSWSQVQYLPSTDPPTSIGASGRPALAVGPTGAALSTWPSNIGYGESTSPPSGAWATPVTFSNELGYADMARLVLDGTGDAILAVHPGQFEFDVYVRDASGPDLVPSIPATAVAGVPISVSVQAVDRWAAPVGSPIWTFGDGSLPTMASTHVYAGAGTYTVSVSQADTHGNVGVATREIVVAPAPPPPDPPSLGLASARFAVQWRASVPRGQLVLRGRSDVAASVNGALTRGKFRKPLGFTVGAGRWVVRIPMPRSLLPGVYQVRLSGRAGDGATQPGAARVRLAAPPEGVVSDYRVSVTRNGPDGLSFRQPRRLFLRFDFAALPRPGTLLRLTIVGPRGRVGVKVLRRRPEVEGFVGNTTGRLAPGKWRFTLRAGKTVVKRVAVTIR